MSGKGKGLPQTLTRLQKTPNENHLRVTSHRTEWNETRYRKKG